MKEESLLLLSDLQKLINQVVLIDYTIIILGDENMVMRDKSYKTVEIITLICFSISVVVACITRFIPFIFLTLLTFPISFKLLKGKVDSLPKNKEDKQYVN